MWNSIFYTLLAFIFLCYLSYQRQKSKSQIPAACRSPRELPTIDRIFGLDHSWKTLKLREQHRGLEVLSEWHKAYGNTFKVLTLGSHVIHTTHPENLKAIFGTKWKEWGVGRLKAMEPFCGRGFVTTDGEEWRGHRALLAPTLNDASDIDLNSLDFAYEEYLGGLPVDGTAVDLAPIFEELFLDLSWQFLFGRKLSNMRSVNSPVDMPTFQRSFNTAQFWMGIRKYFGIVGRILSTRKLKQSSAIVHLFIDHFVQLTLEDMATGDSNSRKSPKRAKTDVKTCLIESLAIQGKSPIEIRCQITQGMLVTQDTTGIVLSNIIFSLSRSPHLWQRLRKEVASLGPYQNWTVEALKSSKLLQNIIKESQRLHPLFGTDVRVALVDTILPTGGGSDGSAPIFVSAGTRVNMSLYTLHRQESIFGSNAGDFDPDRWDSVSPGMWEFMPFTHGPRSCAGRHKALSEASYIIARMATQFARIESRDERPWTEEVKLVVKNFCGCKVALYVE